MSTQHEGLRAWFELLRTERYGQRPKYQVDWQGHICCSYPGCKLLAVTGLTYKHVRLRQKRGPGYLFASRHRGPCPWYQRGGNPSQNSFTTQPLERAYLYWALFEHNLTHK